MGIKQQTTKDPKKPSRILCFGFEKMENKGCRNQENCPKVRNLIFFEKLSKVPEKPKKNVKCWENLKDKNFFRAGFPTKDNKLSINPYKVWKKPDILR